MSVVMSRGSVRLLGPLLGVAIGIAQASALAIPPAEWILDQVKALSAPEMEGRRSGTPGADRAARHISGVFQQAGLRPGADAGSFLQSFQVPTGIRLGSTNELNTLAPSRRSLVLGGDFVPLAVSADGDATGELVFLGYGISATDLGYDDYTGVDVRGKVVLAMTGEPRGQDPASPFRRPEAYHYSERSHKIINAREHGACAILLVANPAAKDALPALGGVSQPWGILAAAITRSTADALLGPAGERLADLADAIDRKLTPRPLPLPGVRVGLKVDLVREHGTTANVIQNNAIGGVNLANTLVLDNAAPSFNQNAIIGGVSPFTFSGPVILNGPSTVA